MISIAKLLFGVYYCTRAFMPLLLASQEGHLINISSINGFWACLGPFEPHTAYSSSKFAVKDSSKNGRKGAMLFWRPFFRKDEDWLGLKWKCKNYRVAAMTLRKVMTRPEIVFLQ